MGGLLKTCWLPVTLTWGLSIMVGWEGSAADGFVYNEARVWGSLAVPRGKYYLADAGFASCDTLLVPYRSTQYHLHKCEAGCKKWVTTQNGLVSIWRDARPQTKEELFNLHHAQLHNIVEWIFGVLKHEFKLAAEPSDYCIDTQCLIPLSLTILHNFLCAHEPNCVRNKSHTQMDGLPLTWQDNVGDYIEIMQDKGGIVHGTEEAHADARRDGIATAMWSQYQSVHAEQCNRERRD